MSGSEIINVLFLCTGNSARSILAEALLNHDGGGRIRAYSAGSTPKGEVSPTALGLLRQHGVPAAGLRSKSWDEFAAPGAPEMDFVITVCDKAAKERCPVWPGHPITADWSLPDPVAIAGAAEQRAAFRRVFTTLQRRIGMLVSAKLTGADRARLERTIVEIGDHVPMVED
jgi:arsenate reductase (thioredoxin)